MPSHGQRGLLTLESGKHPMFRSRKVTNLSKKAGDLLYVWAPSTGVMFNHFHTNIRSPRSLEAISSFLFLAASCS